MSNVTANKAAWQRSTLPRLSTKRLSMRKDGNDGVASTSQCSTPQTQPKTVSNCFFECCRSCGGPIWINFIHFLIKMTKLNEKNSKKWAQKIEKELLFGLDKNQGACSMETSHYVCKIFLCIISVLMVKSRKKMRGCLFVFYGER